MAINEEQRRTLLFGAAAAAAGVLGGVLLRRATRDGLEGEVAIVTGSSRGLGLEIARTLGAAGCRLVVCARDARELGRAAAELTESGYEVLAVPCDIGKRTECERLVRQAEQQFGRVDIVVNNAGIIEVGPVESMTPAAFERLMDVMYWGTVWTTLAALPGMRQRGYGRIANITSIGGKISVPHLLPYSGAKFAAVGFSEGLRAEVSTDGISVTTVVPGLMRTGSYRNARFRGDARNEFRWFATASTLPLLSMSAHRAARQVVDAIRARKAEVILSATAKAAVRAHGVAPATSSAILGLIDRFLPKGTSRENHRGYDLELEMNAPILETATTLGRRASAEMNELPGPNRDIQKGDSA